MPPPSNRPERKGGFLRRLWRRVRRGGGAPDTPDERSRRTERSASPVRQASMERGHEPENASESVGGIVAATVVVVLSVAVVIVALRFFVGFLGETGPPPLAEAEITTADAPRYQAPPKPRLQVDPAIDLQDLHQREYERLYTYGRVDSARLHIPIERAMRLVAQRGLPADSAASDSAAGDTLLIPTDSGFRVASRRYPGPPRSRPFLGSSPEPYTPAPAIARYLTEDGYLPSVRVDTVQ